MALAQDRQVYQFIERDRVLFIFLRISTVFFESIAWNGSGTLGGIGMS